MIKKFNIIVVVNSSRMKGLEMMGKCVIRRYDGLDYGVLIRLGKCIVNRL